ncbi:MAG: hypothetical protein JWP74_2616 [Marmoricola sp.]|nr:hypothetical protein [Marmoricola sp.]
MIYTALRIGLFALCWVVIAGIAALIFGATGSVATWSFVSAVVISSGLSLKYLQKPRERFAANVEARAARAASRFDELKSREDAD